MTNISILIPAYNVENYIEECLKSVLSQTDLNNIEIVIVDNASTDSTKDIIKKYEREYSFIHGIYLTENVGLFLSRHIAISESIGEYCLFLDSDDMLIDNAIEIIRRDIIKYKDPDMIIYRFRTFGIKEEESENILDFHESKLCGSLEHKKLLYALSTTEAINNIWIKTIKKSKLKEFKDYKKFYNIKYAEDKLNSIYYMNDASIVYNPNVLYLYRLRGNSISNNYNIERFQQEIIIEKELQKIIINKHFSSVETADIYRYRKKSNMHLFILSFNKQDMKKENNCEIINNIIAYLKNNDNYKVNSGIIWNFIYFLLINEKFDLLFFLNYIFKKVRTARIKRFQTNLMFFIN